MNNNLDNLYAEKTTDYFDSVRREIIDLIQGQEHRILDIGCGRGATARELKRTLKAEIVYGIELVESMAKVASEHMDKVLRGSIEEMDLPFEEQFFDYVIAADVLEHLIDPWQTLRRVTRYLKQDGQIIASVPNVQNWKIIRDLVLKGDWKYTKHGLLDRTHLRFFTEKTFLSLLRNAGFDQIEIIPAFALKNSARLARATNRLTFGSLKGFLSHQYYARARLSKPLKDSWS